MKTTSDLRPIEANFEKLTELLKEMPSYFFTSIEVTEYNIRLMGKDNDILRNGLIKSGYIVEKPRPVYLTGENGLHHTYTKGIVRVTLYEKINA